MVERLERCCEVTRVLITPEGWMYIPTRTAVHPCCPAHACARTAHAAPSAERPGRPTIESAASIRRASAWRACLSTNRKRSRGRSHSGAASNLASTPGMAAVPLLQRQLAPATTTNEQPKASNQPATHTHAHRPSLRTIAPPRCTRDSPTRAREQAVNGGPKSVCAH